MYKYYLNALNKMNDFAVHINGGNELGRLSLSDERWAKDKFATLSKDNVRKGEVWQFEFGKNYIPEIAYEHRGLVMGINKKLLYVLPIFSYNKTLESHKSAYDPKTNPDYSSDYYLLRSIDFDFIKHDSVLKLNDLRSISVNRKLYKHKGKMDIGSDAYKDIENLAIRKHFASFYFDFCKLKENYDDLQSELENMKLEKETLEQKIQEYIKQNETKST